MGGRGDIYPRIMKGVTVVPPLPRVAISNENFLLPLSIRSDYARRMKAKDRKSRAEKDRSSRCIGLWGTSIVYKASNTKDP